MAITDIEELLAKQRHEAEERDAKRRAERSGVGYLDLISVRTPTEIKAMELVEEEDARKALLVPVQIVGKKFVVATYDPELPETKTLISKLKENYDVTVVVTTRSDLNHAWNHYAYIKKEGEEISGKITIDPERIEAIKKEIQTLEDLTNTINEFESPEISQVIEIVVGGAIAVHASDIHLEPGKEINTFRLRIDGMLHTVSQKVAPAIHRALITRIKLLSNLKLNIKDEPQDGRFTIDLPDRDIEIRTSIIPSEYGETVVMRLLDPKALKINLEDLGWRKDDLAIIAKEVEKPNGLILNTGPTGSGKTTTLYAFLKRITKPEIKIITVEDPIEYHISGISQTQVDPDAGYTFASGLRSILRQDPDVILIGEIRDKETAKIALNASLTGHMVFSTLHTNDAIGAVPRLLDLGAKSNILGPALSLVIAQRLVRKLCNSCKKEIKIDTITRERIVTFLNGLPKRVEISQFQNFNLYEPVGCQACNGLGYKGRTSVFELFVVTETIEEEVYKSPTELELKKLAKQQGMVTIQEDGVLKVLLGITSFAEIERLTGPIDWTKK